MSKPWVPPTAEYFTLHHSGPGVVSLVFYLRDEPLPGCRKDLFNIEELPHILAIQDVRQQIREKPLSDRIVLTPKADMVNEPPHYNAGEIECIDAIRAALTEEEFRGYCKGNMIKYEWRERFKGGLESIRKAMWYGQQMIKHCKEVI